MNAAHSLQYGNRFGADIAKLAKESLAANAGAEESVSASARYTRWFYGSDEISEEPMATSRKKFRKIDRNMAASEVAAATRENMAILGEDAFHLFMPKMPSGHRLRKAVRAGIWPSIPYLGLCKFGEIVSGRVGDSFAVTQIFITNFDGKLDTSSDSKFCTPVSPQFDQMIFGVHVLVDRHGNRTGFNQARGNNGVAFNTKNINDALYNIAAASTGMSLEALQARAKQRP